MRKARAVFQLTLFLGAWCSPGRAWGPEGHQIVGRIAGLNLNPNAAQQVASILGISVDAVPGEMANAATWADTVRPLAPETSPWHFVDIPRDPPNGKPSDFCSNGDCVTFRIADFAQKLKNNAPGPGTWNRAQQLKFLIHFVGDSHQPLHCATNSDRGGNCIKVTPSTNQNLHHVWDSVILADVGTDEEVLAQQFSDRFRALSNADKQKLLAGTPDDWAVDANKLALSQIYTRLKIGVMHPQIEVKNCQTDAPPQVLNLKIKLTQAYIDLVEPVVQDQLMRAGARLANILNTIWPAS